LGPFRSPRHGLAYSPLPDTARLNAAGHAGQTQIVNFDCGVVRVVNGNAPVVAIPHDLDLLGRAGQAARRPCRQRRRFLGLSPRPALPAPPILQAPPLPVAQDAEADAGGCRGDGHGAVSTGCVNVSLDEVAPADHAGCFEVIFLRDVPLAAIKAFPSVVSQPNQDLWSLESGAS
jgi:hypothetical protein